MIVNEICIAIKNGTKCDTMETTLEKGLLSINIEKVIRINNGFDRNKDRVVYNTYSVMLEVINKSINPELMYRDFIDEFNAAVKNEEEYRAKLIKMGRL